jgi:hypothetical protein
MRKLHLGWALGILSALACTAVSAQPFAVGDVLTSVGNSQMKVFTQAGVLRRTLTATGANAAFNDGMCVDASGNVYQTGLNSGNVSKYDANGNLVNATYITGVTRVESCVFNRAGEMFVGIASSPNRILKYNVAGPTGALIATYNTAAATDWIELSSDQCTMLYTNESPIVRRIDVCTNTQLPNLTTIAGATNLFAMRFLPTGEILAAGGNGVYKLSATGTVLQTWPRANAGDLLFALNLDPDGASFWTGSITNGNVYKYNRTTVTAPQVTFNAAPNTELGGLMIYGEVTAGGPGPGPAPGGITQVPTLSEWSMILLMAITGLFAAMHLRRRR